VLSSGPKIHCVFDCFIAGRYDKCDSKNWGSQRTSSFRGKDSICRGEGKAADWQRPKEKKFEDAPNLELCKMKNRPSSVPRKKQENTSVGSDKNRVRAHATTRTPCQEDGGIGDIAASDNGGLVRKKARERVERVVIQQGRTASSGTGAVTDLSLGRAWNGPRGSAVGLW